METVPLCLTNHITQHQKTLQNIKAIKDNKI
jgi:hypothetical protein